MKNQNRFRYSLFAVVLILTGCTCSGWRGTESSAASETAATNSLSPSLPVKSAVATWDLVPPDATVLYQPQYARNFLLTKEGNQTVLYTRYSALTSPQNGHTSTHRYVIKPARRVVCLSTSHIACIDVLHQCGRIVGVSGKKYVYSQNVAQAAEVGYEAAIDYEALLRLKPDVVFAYYINGQPMDYLTRMEQLGLNVVLLHDHTEPHPLGRAEYTVAFAAFFAGNESRDNELLDLSQAVNFFNSVKNEYLSLCRRIKDAAVTPVKVLINAPFKDVWYVPSLESHANLLVQDAGGELSGAVSGPESSTLNIEQAYIYALQADFWIHPNNCLSLADLTALDPRFARVPCVQNGAVWNNNLRYTAAGGNDYYESAIVYPQRILADLIAIFHPDLMPEHRFEYYRQLSR